MGFSINAHGKRDAALTQLAAQVKNLSAPPAMGGVKFSDAEAVIFSQSVALAKLVGEAEDAAANLNIRVLGTTVVRAGRTVYSISVAVGAAAPAV